MEEPLRNHGPSICSLVSTQALYCGMPTPLLITSLYHLLSKHQYATLGQFLGSMAGNSWCYSDDQTHLICKPRPPALDRCQKDGAAVGPSPGRTGTTGAYCQHEMPPHLHDPSPKPPFSPELAAFVPESSYRFLPTNEWECPRGNPGLPTRGLHTRNRKLTLSREASRQTQAPGGANQRESRGMMLKFSGSGRVTQ